MTHKKKTLAGLLALPLVLGACDVTAHMKVNEDKTADVTMEIHDTNNLIQQFGGGSLTCDDLASELSTEDDVTIEDISTGDYLSCRISGASGAVGEDVLTETDETFIVTVDSGETGAADQDLAMFEDFGLNFTYSIEMPGDIIRAEGAEIDGNVATFTDIEVVSSGFEVEGYKTAGGGTGSSPILWIVLGLVALAAIVGALLFFRNKNKAGGPADQNVAGGPAGQAYQGYEQPGRGYAPPAGQPTSEPHVDSQTAQSYVQPEGQATSEALGYDQPLAGQSPQGQGSHDLNNPEPPVSQR